MLKQGAGFFLAGPELSDLVLTKDVLYQLSYKGVKFPVLFPHQQPGDLSKLRIF